MKVDCFRVGKCTCIFVATDTDFCAESTQHLMNLSMT